jgi:signal peptidase II
MRLLAVTALIAFALDQALKWFVVWHLGLVHRLAIDVWPPFLNLRMAWNRGVNFGLFAQDGDTGRWVLIGLALAICAWVVWWMRCGPRGWRAEGLLVGGALGNVVDRVLYGAVADFLNMSCCGIDNPFAFNIADAAIFAGAIGLALFAGERPRDGAGGMR